MIWCVEHKAAAAAEDDDDMRGGSMNADQLRQALDYHDANDSAMRMSDMVTFIDAARRWLSLLEADETMVERIEIALDPHVWEGGYIPRKAALDVLAAIVGEET